MSREVEKGIIFTNPPAVAREGQQRRGMFPLPLISLANSLGEEINVEHASPDLLADYSFASEIISQSNAEWLAMTSYQETTGSVLELARTAKSFGKKVVLGGAPHHHMGRRKSSKGDTRCRFCNSG